MRENCAMSTQSKDIALRRSKLYSVNVSASHLDFKVLCCEELKLVKKVYATSYLVSVQR